MRDHDKLPQPCGSLKLVELVTAAGELKARGDKLLVTGYFCMVVP